MDRRYEARLGPMLAHAEVPPDLIDGFLSRLEAFVLPFGACLASDDQRRHAREYLTGLLSKLEHKTAEGIAYLHDRDRQGLQKFIGLSPWDHAPLLRTLARQVGEDLGEADGVIVFDPSGFVKKGTKSAGVARQWCGRVGKTDNCQVGVYMAYVSRKEHALVNAHLYLPKEWTKDRGRCEAAGIPRGVGFRTRHQLALEMLDEHGAALPHAWVAGDDEMGHPFDFRLKLAGRDERYLLAVPSNTWVRDIEAPPPEPGSRGPRPWNPFLRMDRWREALAEAAWTTIEGRDGEKGPLVVEVVKRRVRARTPTNGTGPQELLVITRERQHDGSFKHDYYLSNADPETPLKELARVTRAAHRIEECFKRAKGEAGLGDYQVRTWIAWYRHQTLALLAAWFLNRETRRGKNPDRRVDVAATAAVAGRRDRGAAEGQPVGRAKPAKHALASSQRVGAILSPPHS
jgi:SRSO17 transposase